MKQAGELPTGFTEITENPLF